MTEHSIPRDLVDVPCPASVFIRARVNFGHTMGPDVALHQELLLDWVAGWIGALESDEIINYPADPHHDGRPTVIYMGKPLLDLSTASYQDNAVMLWFIHYFLTEKNPALKYIIITGDEQTYDRMIKIKSNSPQEYEWRIPWPGEFHCCGHVLHCIAIYRLW